jgi:hypothetical protein
MYPESRTLSIDHVCIHPQPNRNSALRKCGLGTALLLAVALPACGCGGNGSVTGQSSSTTASGGSGSGGSGSGGSGSGGSGTSGSGNNGSNNGGGSGSGSSGSGSSGSGSSGSGSSGGGSAQQSGTTISNVQTPSGNWQSFAQIGPKFIDCLAPCSEASWQQVYDVSNPSKSGKATEFDVNPKRPGADVLFTAGVIGTTSPQHPDAKHKLLPTLHDLTYSADFYVTDESVTSALEFDISMFMEGITGMTFGTQCAHLQDGTWDIWNNGKGQWISSGVPCQFQNGWNHVTLEFQRQTNNDTLYKSITLNGRTYTINKEYPPARSPKGWWGLAANFQMDSDRHGDPMKAYVDNMSITYQ